MKKQDLINELLQSPQTFSSKKVNQLLGLSKKFAQETAAISEENVEPFPPNNLGNTIATATLEEDELVSRDDLLQIVRRVFDMNSLDEFGKANKGWMGKFNRRSQKKRRKRFFKKIRKNPNAIKVYAEGDSWFEHPLMKEILDWMRILNEGRLFKRFWKKLTGKKSAHDVAVYSAAYGGDWLINIINEGTYITDISRIQPDVIMLSAGGNDVVGDKKIAMMIDKKGYESIKYSDALAAKLKEGMEKVDENRAEFIQFFKSNKLLKQVIQIRDLKKLSPERFYEFAVGLSYLSKDFFAFLWAFELLYKYIIQQITRKHEEVKIITQGYDYPIPSSKRASFFQPVKAILNRFMDNGSWLKDAISLRKIEDPFTQRAIMMAIIHLFNDMLIRVGSDLSLGANIVHIDSRGLAKPNDWYDEMHLNEKLYKKIAEKYLLAITNPNINRGIVKVSK